MKYTILSIKKVIATVAPDYKPVEAWGQVVKDRIAVGKYRYIRDGVTIYNLGSRKRPYYQVVAHGKHIDQLKDIRQALVDHGYECGEIQGFTFTIKEV